MQKPMPSKPVHEDNMYDSLRDAVSGGDEPMEDSNPKSTGLMVVGAYPIALFVMIAVATLIAFLKA